MARAVTGWLLHARMSQCSELNMYFAASNMTGVKENGRININQ